MICKLESNLESNSKLISDWVKIWFMKIHSLRMFDSFLRLKYYLKHVNIVLLLFHSDYFIVIFKKWSLLLNIAWLQPKNCVISLKVYPMWLWMKVTIKTWHGLQLEVAFQHDYSAIANRAINTRFSQCFILPHSPHYSLSSKVLCL